MISPSSFLLSRSMAVMSDEVKASALRYGMMVLLCMDIVVPIMEVRAW
jgi:hypothetical protein